MSAGIWRSVSRYRTLMVAPPKITRDGLPAWRLGARFRRTPQIPVDVPVEKRSGLIIACDGRFSVETLAG
jgi:hypothetical protein